MVATTQAPFVMQHHLWPPAPKQAAKPNGRYQNGIVRVSPVCLCCVMFRQLENHKLDECPRFLLFTVDDRRKLMEWWNVCDCCNRYGQRKCNTGPLCGRRQCGADPHCTMLCRYEATSDYRHNRQCYEPTVTNQTVMVPASEPPYCLCCVAYRQLLVHPLWLCERFGRLSVFERRRMADAWLICRVCTKYGHKTCEAGITCKNPTCEGNHNPIFCHADIRANTKYNNKEYLAKKAVRDATERVRDMSTDEDQ